MSEIELVNAIRQVAVDAVAARSKPVTIQIGEYNEGKVVLGGDLEVEAYIPPIFTSAGIDVSSNLGDLNLKRELKNGDRVLVLKQNGAYKYYVIDKL